MTESNSRLARRLSRSSRFSLLTLTTCLVVVSACVPKGPSRTSPRSPIEENRPPALAEAQAAAARGDWSTARSLYAAYVSAHPDTVGGELARLELGMHQATNGDCERANNWLDRVTTSSDSVLARRAQLYLASCNVLGGRTSDALKRLAQVTAHPVNPADLSTLWRALATLAERAPMEFATWSTIDQALHLDSDLSHAHAADALRALDAAAATAPPTLLLDVLGSSHRSQEPWRSAARQALGVAIDSGDLDTANRLAAELTDAGHAGDAQVSALLTRLRATEASTSTSIGVFLPISGRGKAVGDALATGIRIAADVLGGPAINIVDSEAGSAPLETLLRDPGTIAVLGPVARDSALAAASQASSTHTALIAFAASEDSNKSSNAFRFFYSPTEEIRALVKAAIARGVQRFGILYPDHGYGQYIAGVYAREVQAHGASTCAPQAYDPATNSVAQSVDAALADATCQAFLLADAPDRIGVIAPSFAVHDAWSTAPGERASRPGHRAVHFLLPSVAWTSQLAAKQARYLQGTLVAVPFAPAADDSLATSFESRYREQFNGAPSALHAIGFDAYGLIAAAVRQGYTTRQSLREALESGRVVNTAAVTSINGFGESRAPRTPPRVYSVRAHTLVALDP